MGTKYTSPPRFVKQELGSDLLPSSKGLLPLPGVPLEKL